MDTRLPIPIKHNDVLYTSVTLQRVKSGVVANTKKIADTGDSYTALHVFISGAIESFNSIDGDKIIDTQPIRNLVMSLPFRSAEIIAIDAVLLIDSDDAISGVYKCPLCGEKQISNLTTIGGQEIDTRNYISELDINYMLGDNDDVSKFTPHFSNNLSEPIETNTSVKGNSVTITNYKMQHPTLGDCIKAHARHGSTDQMRLQNAIYIEALLEIDNEEIDKKWKRRYGDYMFDNMPNIKVDLGSIVERIKEFGIDPRINKHCKECGQSWKAEVNTSNFFASALQP